VPDDFKPDRFDIALAYQYVSSVINNHIHGGIIHVAINYIYVYTPVSVQ